MINLHRRPVGDIRTHHGRWILIDRQLDDMCDTYTDRKVRD